MVLFIEGGEWTGTQGCSLTESSSPGIKSVYSSSHAFLTWLVQRIPETARLESRSPHSTSGDPLEQIS